MSQSQEKCNRNSTIEEILRNVLKEESCVVQFRVPEGEGWEQIDGFINPGRIASRIKEELDAL